MLNVEQWSETMDIMLKMVEEHHGGIMLNVNNGHRPGYHVEKMLKTVENC